MKKQTVHKVVCYGVPSGLCNSVEELAVASYTYSQVIRLMETLGWDFSGAQYAGTSIWGNCPKHNRN